MLSVIEFQLISVTNNSSNKVSTNFSTIFVQEKYQALGIIRSKTIILF